MNKIILRKVFLSITALTLFSCADKEQDYDKSKAISAFAIIDQIKPDSQLEKIAITLPEQKNNELWTSSASNINQTIENFAFKSTEKAIKKNKFLSTQNTSWTGSRSFFSDRFVFEPIIKDNKIFLLDAAGKLSCHDLNSKKQLWKNRIFARKYLKLYQNPKIGYFNNIIFAIAGSNDIVAASAIDGKILWSKSISSIPVSTPISDGKYVYITTNDNKSYALDFADGKLIWVSSGINKTTAIFGASDSLIYKNTLLVSYSSGEIYALNKDNGEALWSQNLNINKAVNSDFYLNDIDATPIIKNDIIYTIGNGGLLMAINLKNGNYLWKKEIASIVDFWVAGEFLYLINNENKLIAFSKKNGAIKWISQLLDFKNNKKPETKIIYNGIILAGDKLLISDTAGHILVASPLDGKILQTFDVGEKIYHAPAVVNGKIYLHALGRFNVKLIEIQ